MKIMTKRSVSLILALIMSASLFFGINLPAQAANVDYVKSGKYIYNWGTREEIATFLSQNAIAFYGDNDTSYAELSALSGSNTESSIPSSALYKELQNLMKINHSYIITYNATRDKFQYTDCQNSGKTSNRISSFYSGKEIGPAWDSGNTWNREHTWPNSKGDKAGDGENDIMMLRPSASSENSSRGNKAYGESSGYFNPNNFANGKYDLRGDVARIMLYQYVRWNCTNTGSKYNPNGIFGTNGVIESKEVMLKWIEEDPVDTWELGRNDSVESITGTRNVFVDYPELAFILFGEQVPSDYTTPSGEAKNNTSSGNTSGSQNNNQNNTQNNTQNNNQNNTQNNNTQNNSSVTTTVCNHSKAYKVAAEEPRCESEGYTEGTYCPDCKTYISGHKSVAATGHSYAGDCDATCDTCSETREIDAAHEFGSDGICTVCGESEIAADNPDVNTDGNESISDGTTENDKQNVDSNVETPEKNSFPWWIIIVVAVVVIGGAAVVIVLYRDKIWPKETG